MNNSVISSFATKLSDVKSAMPEWWSILPGLLAVQGSRNEPITYWVVVGDKAVLSGLNEKLQQLRYGLTGSVPDGMLVQVSTIGIDEDQSYQLHEFFIQDILSAIGVNERIRLAGV